jgi:tRNA-splicing ligase RtcB (3'-phosphate/5'-hydroxy nucleic acid ligase)
VFASEHYVCPNAVGVDIGCGMAAIPIHNLYRDDLSAAMKVQIQQRIKERIPCGFNQHQRPLPQTKQVLEQMTDELHPTDYIQHRLGSDKVTQQLGTLGGGNHFLEIVYAEDTHQVFVMLHSGSRNVGNTTAAHYDALAARMLQQQGVDTRALHGINYMPIESEPGQAYLRDMAWCQRYAYENRAAMKKIVIDIVHDVTGRDDDLDRAVNIHHNYCACEDCNGRKLWVTRKGATSAKLGEYGIIPGSMGTGSYITRGRGNLGSWNSSSHGAGRKMSRTRAFKEISQHDFARQMEGIVCDTHSNVKDEAPQAYKDLAVVMEQQRDLTDIVHRLLPLVNVKGFEEYKQPRQARPAKNKKHSSSNGNQRK